MKIFIFLVITFTSTTGYCSEYFTDFEDRDIYLYTTVMTLACVDWYTTRDLLSQNRGLTEANPILGKNPSTYEIDRYFVASALLYSGVVLASPQAFRGYLLVLGFSIEAFAVQNNLRFYSVSMNMKF